MRFSLGQDNIIRLATSIRTPTPDASRSLEQVWLKRRQELAGWQPSNGWLTEQNVATRRPSSVR